MSYALLNPIAGTPSINYGTLPDQTTPDLRTGSIVAGYDPYWGGGEFVYGRAGGAIRQFGVCVCTPAVSSGVYRHNFTEVPNTANLGRSLFVACAAMDSGDYGWFQIAGLVPVNCTADVAADTAFGIVAAGQAGAIANGKQILNARSIISSAATVAKTGCTGLVGSTALQVPARADGWFYGAYLSGTGIAAATTVADISPDGTVVTLSAALTAAPGTVTATYNNATVFYNVAHMDRPFAQGQVA